MNKSRKKCKKKNYHGFAGLLSLLLCISMGCGQVAENTAASAVDTALEETNLLEIPAEPEETDSEETNQEEIYQEDTTQYGNTIGNQYNDGVFLMDEAQKEFYFFNSYEGVLCKTDIETGATTVLMEGLLVHMQLQDGILYGTQVSMDGEDSQLISLDPASGEIEVLRETPPQYLQMADKVFYFTDFEENNLRKLPASDGEEEVLLDEPVYYPVVYKDWIFFQRDSDKESLYRMPKEGGELLKLNDVQSYSPQIYRDRIYYMAQENQVYTLRSMKLDGSDEQILLDAHAWSLNLYDGRLYFVEEGNENVISYLDLDGETEGKQVMDLKENIYWALKDASSEPVDFIVTGYTGLNFSGNHLLFMLSSNIGGDSYQDEFLYDMDQHEIIIITEFCQLEPEVSTGTTGGTSQMPTESPQKTSEGETSQAPAAENPTVPAASSKDAEARAVAQAIADSIPAGSDLERVRAAAAVVAGYCSRAVYTTEDPDYRTAYGVLCKGVYTCAGATRALGLVLECMGYSWSHANANQWGHQWCELTMDGQPGWADGQGGIADYGACPFATGGTYTAPDGRTWQTR